MMCEACERGDHDQCGMQTWCGCDCDGPDGIYLPEDLDAVPQAVNDDIAAGA
jgi:hypothetical protein